MIHRLLLVILTPLEKFRNSDLDGVTSLIQNLLTGLISAAILLSSNITFAAEKLAPAGSKQWPGIFVQLAKESPIYFSDLKFIQEVQIE